MRDAAAEELKLYFDYKSPFAYLAKDPAFALAERELLDYRATLAAVF